MAIVHPFSQFKGGAPTSPQTFSWVFSGDLQGLLYFLGRNYGITPWVNPHTATRVTVIMSTAISGSQPTQLVDRDIDYCTTDNGFAPGGTAEWIAIDLGDGNQLVISDYTLQNGSDTPNFDHTPRNWKLQGSNNVASNNTAGVNAATWVDLDTRSNNTSIASSSGAWARFVVGGSPAAYRWFRILATGINNGGDTTYFVQIGEWEFYGVFTF